MTKIVYNKQPPSELLSIILFFTSFPSKNDLLATQYPLMSLKPRYRFRKTSSIQHSPSNPRVPRLNIGLSRTYQTVI